MKVLKNEADELVKSDNFREYNIDLNLKYNSYMILIHFINTILLLPFLLDSYMVNLNQQMNFQTREHLAIWNLCLLKISFFILRISI